MSTSSGQSAAGNDILKEAERQMKESIDCLKNDFQKVRPPRSRMNKRPSGNPEVNEMLKVVRKLRSHAAEKIRTASREAGNRSRKASKDRVITEEEELRLLEAINAAMRKYLDDADKELEQKEKEILES